VSKGPTNELSTAFHSGRTSHSRVEPPLQAVAREGGEDEVPEIKPFTGLASCQVHNIVLHDDGIVIVRGHIGWDHDINVRLSIFVS
jgi:hypothetical protein